jgi:hypothetical protein
VLTVTIFYLSLSAVCVCCLRAYIIADTTAVVIVVVVVVVVSGERDKKKKVRDRAPQAYVEPITHVIQPK